MDTLFWVSILVVLYVYAGYPALLAVWSVLAARPVRARAPHERRAWPAVSVIVAARNEAHRIDGRIRNLLQQA